MRFLFSWTMCLFLFLATPVVFSQDSDSDCVEDQIEDTNSNGNLADDDSDLDGIPNYLDPDDDNDGIGGCQEVGTEDADGDGIPNYLDLDSDNNGISDLDEGATADSDGDTIPDFIDTNDQDGPAGDADSDGVSNQDETNIGSDPQNPDTDGDGVSDGAEISEPGNPADTDSDGIINVLDTDDDGDGIPTSEENRLCCIGFQNLADFEVGQRRITPFDQSRDVDNDGAPNYLDTDSDGDGKSDEEEGTDDSDKDRIPNYLDANDFDGPKGDGDMDGLTNRQEERLGTSPFNSDTDGDNIPDNFEMNGDERPIENLDSDADGIPNALDTDDDGDCVPTEFEGIGDLDGDGIPNFLDDDSDGDGILDSNESTTVDSDCDGSFDIFDALNNDGPCAVNNTFPGNTVATGNGDRDCDGVLDKDDLDDTDGPCCSALPPGIGLPTHACVGPTSPAFDENGCPVSPFSLPAGPSPQPQSLSFTDEDGLRFGGRKLRLKYLTIPKKEKICRLKNAEVPCGELVFKILKSKLKTAQLRCEGLKQGKGATLTAEKCFVGDQNLSHWLVKNGLARTTKDAPKALQKLEAGAKKNKAGLWKFETE